MPDLPTFATQICHLSRMIFYEKLLKLASIRCELHFCYKITQLNSIQRDTFPDGYYRPKRSFGQGNIFTPVCHSVHRGVWGEGFSLPDPPGMETPPEQTPPPDGEPPQMETPPGWRTPPDGEPPPGWRAPRMENPPRWRTPPDGEPPQMESPPSPGWRTPPMEEPPPRMEPPPPKQTPAYGLRSAGTHPTGMHSCFFLVLLKIQHVVNKIYSYLRTGRFGLS